MLHRSPLQRDAEAAGLALSQSANDHSVAGSQGATAEQEAAVFGGNAQRAYRLADGGGASL